MIFTNINCDHITNPFLENNDIITYSSKSQHYNIFPFPTSPYDHDLQFLDLLYQHDDSMMIAPDTEEIATATNPINENYHFLEENTQSIDSTPINVMINSKKSSFTTCPKKDRHSKIETAHGPRDRRMRLSLDVARKFFGLQDMLGFDKASRTVEWLLRNSSSAIDDLKTSCSVIVNNIATCSSSTNCENACDQVVTKTKKAKRIKESRGAITVPIESRRKARERARERTSRKRLVASDAFRYHDNNADFSHQGIEEFQICCKTWDQAYDRSSSG